MYSMGFPATASGIEIRILKYLFSDADGAMFVNMSHNLEAPAAVAERLGQPEETVADRLDDAEIAPRVNADRCIGCGLCVSICPTEAVELTPKPEQDRAESPPTMVDQMMKMAPGGATLTHCIRQEAAGFKEGQGVADGQAVAHDKGMGGVDHPEVGHARQPGAFHRNFSVVGAGDEPGQKKIHGPVSRDDADLPVYGAELVGYPRRIGPELLTGRAVEPAEQGIGLQAVHHLAAVVGRAEHDDAAGFGDDVPAQVAAHQNAAHGMSDEMDGAGAVLPACRQGLRKDGGGKGVNILFRGRVSHVHHPVAMAGQVAGHGLHGCRSPGQAMEEHHIFPGPAIRWRFDRRFHRGGAFILKAAHHLTSFHVSHGFPAVST